MQVPKLITGDTVGLAGALPPSVGELGSLTRLDLPRNDLTAVPAEIAGLSVLNTLYLTTNQITAFPDEFGTLGALRFL